METTNNTFNEQELDDLRQQMSALREKVDKHGHLNEALVKKAIQKKMRGVHRTILIVAIFALLVIPLYISMMADNLLSLPFTIATIVMLFGFVITDFFVNRIDVGQMGDDLMETARKLTQMKKNRSLSQKIGLGVCVPWIAWFIYEIVSHDPTGSFTGPNALILIVCIFAGALIGAIIGIMIYRKMQRTNDEMISQINELMSEE